MFQNTIVHGSKIPGRWINAFVPWSNKYL